MSEPVGAGDLSAELLLDFLGELRQQRREEEPRRDGANSDGVGRKVPRNRQRHSGDSALGSSVSRLSNLAVVRGDAGSVDDDAALPVSVNLVRGHLLSSEARDVERADRVDRHDFGKEAEGVGALLGESLGGDRHASAGDGGVDLPVGGGHLLKSAGHVLLGSNVRGREHDLIRSKLGNDLVSKTRLSGEVADHDAAAGAGDVGGGGAPETGGAAGYEGDCGGELGGC